MNALAALPWSVWGLPVLFLAVWLALWWRSRPVRLWFALLAPVAAVLGVCAGFLHHDEAGPCTRGSCHDVPHWAASVDSASGGSLLSTSALLTLPLAVTLSLITLVVEYIMLVRRQNAEARQASAP